MCVGFAGQRLTGGGRLNQSTPPLERHRPMKQLLLTAIAAVVLVGCGEPSIHDAAWNGNIEAVKQHLTTGTDVNAKGSYGYTPLHAAVNEGQKEIAELLIAEGADVNAKDAWDNETPLHRFAAIVWLKRTETADLLRSPTRADVNVTGEIGTPLDREVFSNHPESGSYSCAHNEST